MNEQTASSSSLPAAASGATGRDEIAIFNLLIAIAERKRIVFMFTAIFAVAAIIISLDLPKRYTASVTILPPQQGSSSLSAALASQLGGTASLAGSSLGLKNANDTYVAMLRSRTVQDAMIQRFDLMREYKTRYISDARRVLGKYVAIDGSGKDSLIRILVQDNDPHRAAELANGYVEEYQKLSEHIAITEAAQRRLFFERQLEQAKNNLATSEEALRISEQTTGIIQLDSQSRALIESAGMLRAQITAKEVQIQGMRTYATGENAQLILVQKELDSLRAQLARLGDGNHNQGDGFIIPKGRIPGAGLEYARRLRDVKYNETIFEILARQFETAKLDEAKQGALIQVIDPAVPPDRRSAPNRVVIVLSATLAGFFTGILAAVLMSWIGGLHRDPEVSERIRQLRKALSIRGIGKHSASMSRGKP